MEELFSLVSVVQSRLRDEMTHSGVTFEDAAKPLGYSNKSSIARLLAKDRMGFEDLLKILVLCKKTDLVVQKPFTFKIFIKATSVAQVDALMEALRHSIFKEGTTERYRLPDKLTWSDIAGKTGFDSGKSARKSWFLLQTPLYLVVGVLQLLYSEAGEHEVTSGNSVLRISVEKRK